VSIGQSFYYAAVFVSQIHTHTQKYRALFQLSKHWCRNIVQRQCHVFRFVFVLL